MSLKRVRRIKPIRMKRTRLAIDHRRKNPMQYALEAMQLEGTDSIEARLEILEYGLERAMEGNFRFFKEIIDLIDGPIGGTP